MATYPILQEKQQPDLPRDPNEEFEEATAETWTPRVRCEALAMRVLAVATTRIEGTWTAYCDAVPGERHDQEYGEVLRTGDKLPEHVAQAIFGRTGVFQNMPYVGEL